MTGRRLVIVGTDHVELEDYDVSEPGPGQVLMRVSRSQISGGSEKNGVLSASDDSIRRPTGYTTVGRVLASGPGMEEFKPGDRVLAFGNHGTHWLTGRKDLNEHKAAIHRIEYEISDEQAAFAVLGDVGLMSVRRAELQIDESVAVFGQGVVGQMVTAFCRISGAHPIIAVDLDDRRLQFSRISGATHIVNASRDDAVAEIRRITGDGAQCVFHAARIPEILVPCMQAASDRGKVILSGSPPGTVEIGLQVELLRRELDIRGVYGRGLEDIVHPYWPWSRHRNRNAIMRLIESRELTVDPFISHVEKPEKANELYHKILNGHEGWMSIFFDWDD